MIDALLIPATSPGGLLEHLGPVALALAIAQVHALEHRRPVLRFGAAGSGLDVDEARRRIHRIAEHPAELHAGDAHLDRSDVGGDRVERRVVVVGRARGRTVPRCPGARRRARSTHARPARALSFPCRAPGRASDRPRSSDPRARARPRQAAPPSHRSQRYLRRSAVRARRSSSFAAIWFSCSASMARHPSEQTEIIADPCAKPLPDHGFLTFDLGAAQRFDLSWRLFRRPHRQARRSRRNRIPMHTPEGFTPKHVLPDVAAVAHARVRVPRRAAARSAARTMRRSSPTSPRRSSSATGRRRALPRRPRRHRVRRGPARRRRRRARRLAVRGPAFALLQASRAVARDRPARLPGRRVGPHAPLLRSLRNADARQARRAREGVPGLRAYRVSARLAGDDGAGDARPRVAAGALAALSAGHVQRARRLRRAGRDDRGLRPPRGARGSRHRGRRTSGTSPASRGRFRIR